MEQYVIKGGNPLFGEVDIAVSYTHLDVYKRQGLLCGLWPQSTFPSEASGAKYDQRLTPTHRVPTMQPPLRQSVLCVGEKQKGCTIKKFWNRTKSVLCVGEK